MKANYFGNEDPIGKTLEADNKNLFKVMGILENIPKSQIACVSVYPGTYRIR